MPAPDRAQQGGGAAAERILAAAMRRFAAGGYRATALAAIAADVGMSTPNLYRYFAGKQALAAACAERILAQRIDCLQRALWAPATSACERLEHVLRALHAHTRRLLDEQPGVKELVALIQRERPDLVARAREAEEMVIEWAIRDGLRRGELRAVDPRALAREIHAAAAVLRIPQALESLSAERAAEIERGVAALCRRALEGAGRGERP